MRYLLLFLSMTLLYNQNIQGQTHKILHDTYEQYKEKTITQRRFKHSDIENIIKKLNAPFEVKEAGKSIEGRPIYLVKVGTGKTKVLLWSQMHGDEPSATMALMDIFNFLSADDEQNELRKTILENVTLYFIPLLNPDGAEKYTRRNALGIDLNRDALRLQSTEANILKNIRDETDAEWGFNLHDQSRYYGAGWNPHQATISFLAPAYDFEKSVNDIRGNAMKLIGVMNEALQNYIPNKVAKYNDDFEPRAFGDNIQKWGTSTILIESGGYPNDREKQYIRQLNYIILLTSFESIANKNYQEKTQDEYNKIPFNESNFYKDLIIRNGQVEIQGKWYTMDIAINLNEIDNDDHSDFQFKSYIKDFGDMSIFQGYENFDATDYKIVPGKVYPKRIKNIKKFKKVDIIKAIEDGYTDFPIEKYTTDYQNKYAPFKFANTRNTSISVGNRPSLLLQKDGKTKFVVLNGTIYNWEEDKGILLEIIKRL